jgi:predicted amidohydrolase
MATDGTIVTVAQLALAVGEVDANRKLAAAAVAEAAERGARLVVLPELCDTGYVFSSAAEARALAALASDSDTLRQWRSLAASHDIVLAGGFCELGVDGRLYNSAAIVDQSGTRVLYRKAHLWDTEKKIFTPGDDRPPVVELAFGNVGLMICYDLEFPEWVRLVTLAGADLIAAPVNWPYIAPGAPAGERPADVVRVQAAAAVNGVFIAAADRCGVERDVSWVGGSVIVGPAGFPLAGPVLADKPAILAAVCDLPRARDKQISPANNLFTDRRPHLYRNITN